MAWVYLFVAGIFETVWVVAMKYADGFTKLVPSAIVVVGIMFFGEPATFARLAFVALIIVGLVGLKMVSAE